MTTRVVFFGEDLRHHSVLGYLRDSGIEVVSRIGPVGPPGCRDYSCLHDPGFLGELAAQSPRFGISVYCSAILELATLDLFPGGCLNLHPSPLPRYRGPVPVVSAIINGETDHGVTLHFMDAGVDTGDIVASRSLSIHPDDTGYDLFRRCEEAAFDLFRETFPMVVENTHTRIPQDHSRATVTRRRDLRGGEVDLTWDHDRLYNFVRALTFPPYRPAHATIRGRRVFMTVPHRTPPARQVLTDGRRAGS